MAFWRLYYHLVWATGKREHLITQHVEPSLFAYLTYKAGELDVVVYEINSWYDHVHMIVAIPPKHSVSTVVKRLKGASSHFVNDRGVLDVQFRWQRGYGVLSLGEKQLPTAIAYVRRQKEHHQGNTANSWLERINVDDEGPRPPGQSATAVRESSPEYGMTDEYPF